MQKYISKEVVCPFYHKEEATKILCEGFCKTTSLQTSFQSKVNLQLHKERHCNDIQGCQLCPLYKLINRQYEGE